MSRDEIWVPKFRYLNVGTYISSRLISAHLPTFRLFKSQHGLSNEIYVQEIYLAKHAQELPQFAAFLGVAHVRARARLDKCSGAGVPVAPMGLSVT